MSGRQNFAALLLIFQLFHYVCLKKVSSEESCIIDEDLRQRQKVQCLYRESRAQRVDWHQTVNLEALCRTYARNHSFDHILTCCLQTV